MLKKLIVERFKSIRAATIELGRVNLFIGGNGAGKSNILEAIGVLSASIDRGLGETDLSRKGVRITPPELMKSAFKKEKSPRTLQLTAILPGNLEYRINLTGREEELLLAFFSERCMHGQTQIFGRSPNGARVLGESIHGILNRHRGMWDQVRTPLLKFPAAVETSMQRLSQYVIYSPQTDFLRGLTPGRVDTPPIGLHGEGLPQAVRGLIVQWENTKGKQSSTFKLKTKRLILHSCHSGQVPTSLDAFDLFDDHQRVFVVARNQDGHTSVTRLRPHREMTREEWQQAKNGRNLSQLWLDGEIVGALGEDL